MSMSDRFRICLTRIRNAQAVNKVDVSMPDVLKLKMQLLLLYQMKGIFNGFSVSDDGKSTLTVEFKVLLKVCQLLKR